MTSHFNVILPLTKKPSQERCSVYMRRVEALGKFACIIAQNEYGEEIALIEDACHSFLYHN